MKMISVLVLAAVLTPAAAQARMACTVTVDEQPAQGLLGEMGPITISPVGSVIPHFIRPVTDHNGVTRRPAITYSLGDEGDILTVRILDFSQTKRVGTWDSAKLMGFATVGLVNGQGRVTFQVGDVPGDPVIKVDCR